MNIKLTYKFPYYNKDAKASLLFIHSTTNKTKQQRHKIGNRIKYTTENFFSEKDKSKSKVDIRIYYCPLQYNRPSTKPIRQCYSDQKAFYEICILFDLVLPVLPFSFVCQN